MYFTIFLCCSGAIQGLNCVPRKLKLPWQAVQVVSDHVLVNMEVDLLVCVAKMKYLLN